MRLEPVYLLAPKPKPPSIPTRRAFLLAGGTFFFGIGVGGACGYAAGVQRGSAGVAEAAEIPPSGDADLDELRRLAVKAPIEELMEKALVFSNLVRANYRNDELLWRGMKRIGEALVAGFEIPDRRRTAVWLAQVIENGEPKFAGSLLGLAEQLRKVK